MVLTPPSGTWVLDWKEVKQAFHSFALLLAPFVSNVLCAVPALTWIFFFWR